MNILFATSLALQVLLISPTAQADPFRNAPPSFDHEGKRVVATDFETLELNVRVDAATQMAAVEARLVFRAREAGFPMLDLVPNPTQIKLDGSVLPVSDFALIRTPDRKTSVRIVRKEITDNRTHTLELSYPLKTDREDLARFSKRGANLGFFMGDLSDREMLEQYSPANFEFDQFRMTIVAEVTGTTIAHQLFTNGTTTELGRNRWRVEYPDHYNSSSPYFHLTDGGMKVARGTFDGLIARIPVTTYSRTQSLADRGLTESLAALRAHEATLGPSTHDSITVYVVAETGEGGMEYNGATATDLWALSHEFMHFWYARGVQPANGNSGWIDEAVASWQDEDYVRATSAPSGAAVNLADRGTYIRYTPTASYSSGMKFLSGLDYMFAARGGLRPILKEIYGRMKRQMISTEEFKQMLEEQSLTNLTPYFDRYVYGRTGGRDAEPSVDDLSDVLVPGKLQPSRLRQL